LGTAAPDPVPKPAIRGHDQVRIGPWTNQADDRVVAGTGSVNHLDPVDGPLPDPGARRAFEDHRDRFG
jgi:hypothetical protein